MHPVDDPHRLLRQVLVILTFLTAPAVANPRLEFARGVVAESRGDEASAATHFRNALAADPLAGPLVDREVARRLASGDRAGAIRLHQEFAASRPQDLSTQLAHADFLSAQAHGDSLALKLATETLDAALLLHPRDPQIIRRLSSLDRSRAATLIDSLSPDDPDSVLLFASVSRSLHEPDDAAALAEIDRRFLTAIDAHPGNPLLAREVSEHFRNTKRTDKAIDVLQRHTAAAPWSLDLRVRLGILDFAAKRDSEGEKMLLDVLAIHPRKALAHQSLAKFYRLKGDAGRAAHHSGELLKIRGGSSSEFLKLADEHLEADRPREARLLLEKAVYDHPDATELRMKLAIASHRDPETRSQSSRLFREAEAAAPGGKIADPAFLSAFAEVLVESGQSRAAEERLRAAIRAYPTDAKKQTAASLRRLASLWETENRNAEAARALRQRANTLDP